MLSSFSTPFPAPPSANSKKSPSANNLPTGTGIPSAPQAQGPPTRRNVAMASDPSKLGPRFDAPRSAARSTPAGSLLAFFLLTYAVMWACFISVAAVGIPAHSPLGALLLYLGTFAPSLAALWLTARAEGSTGVRALLGRVLMWRVAAHWYVFAVSYIAAIKLTVALIHRLASDAWPRFGNEAWYIIVVAIAFSTPFQAGEEIGWRGYALPRVAPRVGLARARILLGLIWGCW